MCRILSFLGPKLPLSELLLEPANSLLNQASAPDNHPLLQLGGWGFAVWSEDFQQPERPLLYRRAVPAFYDDNCQGLVPSLSGTTLLSQIRAVTYGPESVIADENCHPFWYPKAPFALAHNGSMPDWRVCQRSLLRSCDDRWLRQMKGTTDSEFLYVLLLSLLELHEGDWKATLETLMDLVLDALGEAGVAKFLKLKLVMMAQDTLIAANLGADAQGSRKLQGDWKSLCQADPHSDDFALGGVLEPLFLLAGDQYQDHPKSYRVTPCPDDEITTVVLASEMLTEDEDRWREIGYNSLLQVSRKDGLCEIKLEELST